MRRLMVKLGMSLLGLLAFNASATLLMLEGNNVRFDGIFVEGDYQISADIGLVNGGNLPIRPNLVALGFSGDFMETWNTTAVFSLSRVDGDAFDFVGLDVGGYISGIAAWSFTAYNGIATVFSAPAVEAAGRVDFNWANVTRVDIQQSRPTAASFDNIEVAARQIQAMTAPAPINEPAGLGLAFVALALIARKRLN